VTRIAIIGGGVSGLAAAFTLEEHRRAGTVEYTLYEASSRLGGVLRTEHIQGCLVEAGPDSFLTEKPWAADLCRALGLGDQLIGSNDADRKTYIFVRGRLIPMPDGLMLMVPTKLLPTAFSPLFSWITKLSMAQELFHPPRSADSDESVASFVERHYGGEMVDRLADPLLSGIYGGEAASLSVRAVLPRFAEMERTHGSLGRAMLAAGKKIPNPSNQSAPPLFTSLKNGMQQLTDTLTAKLNPSSLLINTLVQAAKADAGGWTISTALESRQYDSIILAVPALSAARILSTCSPELSGELAGIGYNSPTAPPTIALCCVASLRDQTRITSGSFPTTPSSPSSGMNCNRFWAFARCPYLPASVNGNPRWRSTASVISNGWTASSACAGSCPAWRSPATATAASASRIASVLEMTRPGKF